MAFTFIASVTGFAAGVTTTVNASSSLNVQAGDLLVAVCGWQNAASGDTVAVDQSDGTNPFDDGTAAVQADDVGGQLSWLLSGPADATFTPRMTVSASSRRLELIVLQFRPDGGETVTLDAEGTPATGSSTALASGNISTTGIDEVVVGLGSHAGGTFSSPLIDGNAADAQVDGAGGRAISWYSILTATFANGNASITVDNSDNWVCNIVAFKSEAAVGGISIPVVVHHLKQQGIS